MKKFVNNVDDILTESLTGFGDAHNDILEVKLNQILFQEIKTCKTESSSNIWRRFWA